MMKISNVIEIQLSKTKLFFSLLGAIIFAGIGFWLIAIEPPETFYLKFFGLLKFTITNTKLFFACLGLLVILIFGSFAFLTLKKIRDNLPGLIITRDGITDNSNAASVGFIPWEDVIKIEQKEEVVYNQKEQRNNQDFKKINSSETIIDVNEDEIITASTEKEISLPSKKTISLNRNNSKVDFNANPTEKKR